MFPSRWNFDHFDDCKCKSSTNLEFSGESIGIFGILLAVQFESFLWGLGTAIGELPPYFVAYKVKLKRLRLLKHEQN